MERHSLLKRQLKAYLSSDVPQAALRDFIDAVDQAYREFDEDRRMLERSTEISSQELFQANAELKLSSEKIKNAYEQLKEAQAQLVQSEKLSAVGELAAGISHEINNPLGVILGFAQAVVKRLPPNDPFESPLRSIEREAKRCKDLVQNLLTFSRAEKPEKEEMDINETVESALVLITAHAEIRNIRLVTQFNRDIPRVFANRIQIQQVIINLCNNAIDSMPSSGSVTVKTGTARLENAPMVMIEVTDTGHGIPKEIQSKIFDPFFTTKEVGKGTGLGLSLVFEIIEKHTGRITFNSEPGKGTTFRVCLPLLK